ncbi:MAG: DUF998 domain-containing protein [Promethearchaeota archaeon]
MSQLNCIIIKFKNIYDKFLNEKVVKFCIISSLFIFLSGLFIATIIAVNFGPRGYNIWDNFISDLGSLRYTPAPFILDITFMITAVLQIPIYSYFIKQTLINHIKSNLNPNNNLISKNVSFSTIKKVANISLLFLILSSISFFGVGVFSVDRPTILELHLIFSITLFTGLIFGAIFSGIVIFINQTRIPRFLGIYMAIGPITAGILYICPPPSVTRFFLEWIMLFATLIWAIPCLLIMLDQIKEIEK